MPHHSPRPRAPTPTWRGVLGVSIWSLLVAGLLLFPADEQQGSSWWDLVDDPAHMLLFAVQCLLVAGLLLDRGVRRRVPLLAALASGLYAGLLEVAQLWVPGRGFQWRDLVADAVGIALAVVLLRRGGVLG